MNRLVIAACISLVATACAPGSGISPADQAYAPRAERACFLPQSAANFAAGDDQTVYIRAARSEVFEISTTTCLGMDSALSLKIVQPIGTGSHACVGDPVELAVAPRSSSPLGAGLCRAEIVRKLTPTEVAALPPRLRP